MGNYISIVILGLAAIFQSTFLPQIRILGGRPDLVFLIVIAWSFNARLEEAVVWAFVGGIAQDLLSDAPTGTSVLGMLIIIFAINGITRQLYRINLLFIAAVIFVGSLTQQLIVMSIIALTGHQIDFVDNFSYVALPTVVYNLLAVWPIYWVIRRIQRRLTDTRRITL